MFAAAAATTIHSLQRRPFLNKERARDKELFSSPQQKTSKFILYKKKFGDGMAVAQKKICKR